MACLGSQRLSETAQRASGYSTCFATAQAQAEATKEAQRAGIDHAKANTDRYKGRKPTYDRQQYLAVRDLLGQEAGTSAIAKSVGLTRQTVLRIKAAPAQSEAALASWGM